MIVDLKRYVESSDGYQSVGKATLDFGKSSLNVMQRLYEFSGQSFFSSLRSPKTVVFLGRLYEFVSSSQYGYSLWVRYQTTNGWSPYFSIVRDAGSAITEYTATIVSAKVLCLAYKRAGQVYLRQSFDGFFFHPEQSLGVGDVFSINLVFDFSKLYLLYLNASGKLYQVHSADLRTFSAPVAQNPTLTMAFFTAFAFKNQTLIFYCDAGDSYLYVCTMTLPPALVTTNQPSYGSISLASLRSRPYLTYTDASTGYAHLIEFEPVVFVPTPVFVAASDEVLSTFQDLLYITEFSRKMYVGYYSPLDVISYSYSEEPRYIDFTPRLTVEAKTIEIIPDCILRIPYNLFPSLGSTLYQSARFFDLLDIPYLSSLRPYRVFLTSFVRNGDSWLFSCSLWRFLSDAETYAVPSSPYPLYLRQQISDRFDEFVDTSEVDYLLLESGSFLLYEDFGQIVIE